MKNIILFLSLFGLIFAGCKKNEPVESEGDRHIVIFFNGANSASALKSTASDEEDALEKVILYGVNGSSIITFTDTIENPLPTGNEITIPRSIVVETFYAIANPSEGLETELESIELSDPVSDLTALLNDFSHAPQSPFLMAGKGPVSGFSATVDLYRAVAKIEIIAINNFEFSTVTVINTRTEGFVFNQTPFPSLALAALDSASYVPVPPTSLTNDTTILYVAESPKEEPVKFKVKGVFTGGDLIGKTAAYTFALQQDKKNIDIVRNTRYRVHISPITEDEFKLDFVIVPWDDQDADPVFIPEENIVEP